MKRRLVPIFLAMGLVLSAVFSASAFHEEQFDCDWPEFDGWDEAAAHALFPWVPNGADLDGQGPFYGTVTVQNLEDWGINVDFYVGVGTSSTNWELAETVELSANESITLSADALDIPSEGASVAAIGYNLEEFDDADDDDDDVFVECYSERIAGVAKNVSPVASGDGTTNAGHITVDGYSALRGDQVQSDEDQFVLPIVQTNSNWDTTLRVANMNDSGTGLSNVTVTLYEAGGQGFGGASQVINRQVRPGGVTHVLLSDYVPAEWVGSAFITSSADIGAVAERHKAETDMLVTNISRPIASGEQTEQYAALVFKEYNFWNTGISVANVSESQWNQVTITYYGPTGNNVGVDTLNIPPRGMEFVYTPGQQDLGLGSGFVGSARIVGTQPLHAAVDQVKYFGDDPDVGQAMSYIAENETAGSGDALALPLAQKGNPATGTGDTSGIQLFNTDAGGSANVEVVFYSAAGIPVAPTVNPAGNAQPLLITLSAHQSYTLYTHNLTEMSAGYQGSAIIEVASGSGVVGVSNNVNYAVQGDGSVAFGLVLIEEFFDDV